MTDERTINDMLDELGISISPSMRVKYTLFDIKKIDRNQDGKIQMSEVIEMKEDKEILEKTKQDLAQEYNILRVIAIDELDKNKDLFISYSEFESWLSQDSDLLFDRFDLDKSGFLDENELARMLQHRLIPRLDTVMIMLDPDFDGRVYYERFKDWMRIAPGYIFDKYDFDESGDLNTSELDDLHSDIGEYFETNPANLISFVSTKNATTNR